MEPNTEGSSVDDAQSSLEMDFDRQGNLLTKLTPIFSVQRLQWLPPGRSTRSIACCNFFSLQRLHGFRQVVQHVQLHVAKIGLKHTHGRLRIEGPQE